MAQRGRPPKYAKGSNWLDTEEIKAETLKVLLKNRRPYYFQFELPDIFKNAESWLCVTTQTPREFGKYLEAVGFKKEYRRVVNIDEGKKTRSWRAVYIKRGKNA